jgi:membrane protein YqaA with SNARE-associated domain
MLSYSVQAARRRRTSTLAVFRHLGALGLFFLAILDSTPLPTFGGPDILIVILVVTHRNPWYECAIAATAGSIIGAYITFRLARRAGRAYLDNRFGQRKVPKLLKFFDRWGTGALVASTAIPFPLPTSVFFAAAGASNRYSTQTYLSIVAISRAARYSAVAIVRRPLRTPRHSCAEASDSVLGLVPARFCHFRGADCRRNSHQQAGCRGDPMNVVSGNNNMAVELS